MRNNRHIVYVHTLYCMCNASEVACARHRKCILVLDTDTKYLVMCELGTVNLHEISSALCMLGTINLHKISSVMCILGSLVG